MMQGNFSQNSGLPDRLPPQSTESEQCLLGSLMLDKDAIWKVVDFLKSGDFYKSSHQQIFQAMVELTERKEPIDIKTLSTRLKEKGLFEEVGGYSYLTELVNSVPTASNVISYAKTVQKKRVLRELIEASYEIGKLGYQEAENIEEILDRAERRIFGIAQMGFTQRFTPLKATLEPAWERIAQLSDAGAKMLAGLPTGFAALDNLLAGLQKSDLIILASRPSYGKSSLGLNIARHIAIQEKRPVGIFGLEMSKEQIADRFIASQSRIDLWRIRTGRLSRHGNPSEFDIINRALGILGEAPIFIDDAPSPTVLQMKAMARRLQAEHGLSLIIIDYLQLIQPVNLQESMVQQITRISRSLKDMARELNVPVLALSQLSRAVEQRHPPIPRLADLRESGCLTGDSVITRADTGERFLIKDLVGQTNIPVHSLDEDWKIKEIKIRKVFYSGEKMVYKLKTRSGFEIKASSNHPFRKINGWCRLDKLTIGDFIATPRKLSLSSPQNFLSKEEIVLLAHLLGDGCVLPNQPIHYTSSDLENINIVGKLAKNLFQIQPRTIPQKNWCHVYLPSPYALARKKHHPIINWYRVLGIKPVRSYEKEIPERVFALDEKNICLFLKHLWATDGNLSTKYLQGRKPSANLYYATTSSKMAKAVKHLLLRVGIRSKISAVKKPGYRICYQIVIQGKKDQLRFLQEIGTFGKKAKIIPLLINYLEDLETNPNVDVIPKESWKTLIDDIRREKELTWRDFSAGTQTRYCGSALFKAGIGLARMERIATFLQSEELLNLANSDVFWDQIIEIFPLGTEPVYDAEVPETHNFVANGIIVHNSLEQDSDVVIFINRPDRYDQSAPPNIAEITVAKHRNGPIGRVPLFFNDSIVSFESVEERGIEEQEMEEQGKEAEPEIEKQEMGAE